MQVWKTTGKKPKELAEQPPMPEGLEYIWHWFLHVHTSSELSYSELKSWSDLTHTRLKAWEVDLIKTLDRIRWSTVHG